VGSPYQDHIVSNPSVCGGAPIIQGTRVRVKVILDNLAEGHTPQQIVESCPSLSIDDVQAVIAFAAASITDDDQSLHCPLDTLAEITREILHLLPGVGTNIDCVTGHSS